MASVKNILTAAAMASVAAATTSVTTAMTMSGQTPYYAALATGYTTDPASAATSTTTAHQPCVTQPEAGTYCGFINPEDPCSPQPGGYGPVPNSDTPNAFLNFPPLHSMAQAAPTTVRSTGQTQYTQVFKDLDASISGGKYLGLYDLETYNVAQCASLCDAMATCISFDIFAERDPSLLPTNNDNSAPTVWGTNCPNPPSMTVFKCTLWGNVISAQQATNYGSMQEQFKIVITGSDGYTKTNVTVSSSICTDSSSTSTTSPSSSTTSRPSTLVSTTSTPTPLSTSSSSIRAPSTSTTSTTQVSPSATCTPCTPGPVTDSNGHMYNVTCNLDLVGYDLGAVAASTYEDCFAICDNNAECNAFAFDPLADGGAHCWPKNVPSGAIPSDTNCACTVYATFVPPPPPPTCAPCTPGPVIDSNGHTYNVTCNLDLVGYDLGAVAATSYEDCFAICDNNAKCNAFAFDPLADGGAHCWPKNVPSGVIPSDTDCACTVYASLTALASTCAPCTPGPFTDDKSNTYNVSCGLDVIGYDLGPVAANSYEACYDVCDSTANCNAFAFDPKSDGGAHCWPKNVPAGTQPSLEANCPCTVYADLTAPACPVCSSGPVTDKNGQSYTVSCDTEFMGNDIEPVAASCYEDCFDLCDKNPQCNAFAWDPTADGSPHCWLKNIPSDSTEATQPWKGIVFGRMPPGCPVCTSGSYTDSNGKTYTVACNTEYMGHDLGPVTASCYEDCFTLCDQNSECNSFAWDPTADGGSHCWLKNIPSDSTGATQLWEGIVFGHLSAQSWSSQPSQSGW